MKKIFYFILTITLLFTLNVQTSTKTYERTESNNYGVNKEVDYNGRLDNILKTKYVDATEKIYDFSDILTDEEEANLKKQIDDFINKTKMDLVIVTDELKYTYDFENETYAEDFYDYNDFGIDDKHYSGIVLFRNTYSLDPYYIMTLTGDAQLYFRPYIDTILDNIYPDILNRDYEKAFSSFINYLDSYYEKGIPNEMKEYEIDDDGNLHKIVIPEVYNIPYKAMIIIGIIVSSIFTLIFVKKNKMVKQVLTANNYLIGNSIQYSKIIDQFTGTFTSSHRISSDSSSSSSGGGGSSYSSHSGSSGIGHSSGGRHG